MERKINSKIKKTSTFVRVIRPRVTTLSFDFDETKINQLFFLVENTANESRSKEKKLDLFKIAESDTHRRSTLYSIDFTEQSFFA